MDIAHARVAVIGAGNWGTVLADLAAKNGRDVFLWTRNAQVRDEVNLAHTNEGAVRGFRLGPRVRATTDAAEALERAELVLVAVPAQSMRDVMRSIGGHLRPYHFVIHASKGLEIGTHARMTEIIHDETCVRQMGVLSGPNLAGEIACGKPAATAIVSRYPAVVRAGRAALSSERMMTFWGDDVIGVEIAGALKNVVAIAAGAATEMDVGENAKAFLVTRGLAEMMRVGFAMGASPSTFAGLSGIGDLMATCASKHSRNHRMGRALASGVPVEEALDALGMVAEGVPTSRVARELGKKLRVRTPLFNAVYRVVHEGRHPAEVLDELMRIPAGRDASLFEAHAL